MVTMHQLIKKAVELNASDLHLTADSPPLFRIDKALKLIVPDKLNPTQTQKLAFSIMNDQQKKILEEKKNITFCFGVQNLGRFRTNAYYQRGCISFTIRPIPLIMKSLDELGFTDGIKPILTKTNGLILVTGPSGCGKSTTLAAMVDEINSNREGHILTIEDPIEFIHQHKRCIVNQREINHDTLSYTNAIDSVLKQNPDIVLLDDIQKMGMFQKTLEIAESGPLTLASMHTNSAVKTIKRIVDSFPLEQRLNILSQLSSVLEGIISQILLPGIGGGLILAIEILIANSSVRSLIQNDKMDELQQVIESGQEYGMQTLNADLLRLYTDQRITKTDALKQSPNTEELKRCIM